MASDYEAITRYNEEQLGKDTASRKSQVNMYSDFSHFVYEILQNADDYGATTVTFKLNKNELVIEHNGIPFEEENVKAISYFGKSTSRDDLIKTGCFGLGFKSVFAFTASPAIYSNKESFEIYGLYRLKGLSHPHDLDSEKTRIRLPFNHMEKRPDYVETLVPKEKSFDKISYRLKKLDITTLLFTRNILEIKWNVQENEVDYEEGHYLREDKFNKNVNEHLRTRRTEITDGNTLHTYLIFSRPIKWQGDVHKPVDVAFYLDERTGAEVIRSSKKPLFVLFPTTVETHLGFLMNGPFRTPGHRETVSQDDEFNQFLMKEIATLLCQSLLDIRDKGFLSVSLLETLPIRMDDFPTDGMFYPIVAKIREAFMEQALLPSNDGTFVSARNAKLARGAELRKLLSPNQLQELFSFREEIKWLSSKITQDRMPDLRKYVTDELAVDEIRPVGFAQELTDGFLEAQSDEWIIEFYGFLGKDKSELWERPNSILRKKRIIRLQDGSHVKPIKEDGRPNAYLPSSSETSFPTVKKIIVDDTNAKAFLKRLGILETDLFAEVIEFVLPKYTKGSINIDCRQNIEDLKKVILILKDPSQGDSKNNTGKLRILLSKLGLEEFLEQFQQIPAPALMPLILKSIKFIHAKNYCTNKMKYKSAKEVYLVTPDLKSYFESDANAWFVDKNYPEELVWLFHQLDVAKIPRIERRSQDENGYVVITKQPRHHRRGLNGFDPDMVVDGLKYALEHPTIERSLFVWNNIAITNSACIRGFVESSTKKTYENSEKEEHISVFGRLLMNTAWLPDIDGMFHESHKLGLDDLPESFKRDEKLVDQLEMKKDITAKLMKEAGVSKYALGLAKELERQPQDIREKIESLLQKNTSQSESLQKTSTNHERRKEKIIEKTRSAPKKNYEKKPRTIKTTENVIEPKIWLRETYTDNNRELNCQICNKVMPFKKKDGEYYFEAVEIVNDIDKEMEELHLALCPLCAAMYKEFIKRDKDAMEHIKGDLIAAHDLEIPIQLGDRKARLRFVETHFNDLKVIIRELSGNTD